jgi:hypothetical protein
LSSTIAMCGPNGVRHVVLDPDRNSLSLAEAPAQ